MSAPLRVALDQVQWHDGILVDLRLSGFAEDVQQLTLVVELYPADNTLRRRYVCTGTRLSHYALRGDIALLMRNRGPGNIDRMRLQSKADAEILVINLFGGKIEAEAASFQLTEFPA